MILKAITIIMILLASSWSVAALEPIPIGSGPSNEVINLDAGAKQSHQNYNFGKSGFVTPKMPQPMALSPNMMITQAKDIRDDVLAIRDEAMIARSEALAARDGAKAEHDAAQTLLTQIEEKESRINEMQRSVQSSADASSASASRAEELYSKTEEAYARTLGLSIVLDRTIGQMKSLVDEARFHANESALNAAKAEDYLKRIQMYYNKTDVLYKESTAAYNNVTLLAEEIRANSG